MRSPYFHHAQATTLRPMFLLKISFPKISSLKKYKIPKNCVTPFFLRHNSTLLFPYFAHLGIPVANCRKNINVATVHYYYTPFFMLTPPTYFFPTFTEKKRVNLIVMMIIKGKRDDLLYVTIFFFSV